MKRAKVPPTYGKRLPRVAACLIVKNEEETLERCLASFRPHVDEVNVYDTGSTDGTHALLERLAAEPGTPLRWQRGEWRDDFSWARTQSFDMASPDCDYLMWVDGDDVVEGAENIKPAILQQPYVDVFATVYRYYSMDQWRDRIIRRVVNFHWVRLVHEYLEIPIGTSRWRLPPELVRFVHSDGERDVARDIRLLLREKKEQPHELTDYYLACDYLWRGKPGDSEKAAEIGRRFPGLVPSLSDEGA